MSKEKKKAQAPEEEKVQDAPVQEEELESPQQEQAEALEYREPFCLPGQPAPAGKVRQLQPGGGKLHGAHQHRRQQAQGQGCLEGQPPHHQRRCQKAHKILQQRIPVCRQSIAPGIHPQKKHGVIDVLLRVQELAVENAADKRQKQQQVAVQPRRRFGREQQQGGGKERRHIQELSQQQPQQLPQDGQHQAQGLGKAAFIGQAQKAQPVQNAVDPIGHVQPQLQNQGVKPHPAPPSGRR